MHMGWPGDIFDGMEAAWRVGGESGIIAQARTGIANARTGIANARTGIADAGIGIAGATLIAIAAWGAPRLIGSEAIAGPSWLLALLPLLTGTALTLRRRAPVAMWLAIWAGIALLCLLAHNSLRGLAFTFVLLAAAYSLGAHTSFRRAAGGLLLTLPVVYVLGNAGYLGLAVGKDHGGGAGVTLALLQLVAFWLAGVLVYARGQAAALAAQSAELQRQAEQAAAAERTRIARELHDIVAHHLSVIVLQAAGARASGKPAGLSLEKIENSARQALAETRRLLGVLRDPDEEAGLAPQPGIGDLDELASSVRAAGLPVHLVIDGDLVALPAAVDVSVYRIVQEALTNVLKHAGPARADVTIGCAEDTVTVEVTDDGTAQPGGRVSAGGHGLAGMRERAAVFGGELAAGPRPGGGFAVRARLPLRGGLRPAGLP
jgi:signal transduction histidine kinase